MFYYAYVNDQDIVEGIYAFPTKIELREYISIPTEDQTLIGKRYNRSTGQFEDVIMFYYAVLGNKDIVMEVISSETEISDPNKIQISAKNTALVGKWYNRQTSEFMDPPIHILAEHNTQQINIINQDKWLQTELYEIKQELVKLNNGSFGAYKCSFDIDSNQETTSAWVYGKRYTFNFNTGIPGYFPKMIRLVEKSSDSDSFMADLYISKNSDGTVRIAYMDKMYVGVPQNSAGAASTLCVRHNISLDQEETLIAGKLYDGNSFDEGAGAFFQKINPNDSSVHVGNFNYTEDSLSFVMKITDNILGYFATMHLKGYVF